MKHKCALSVGTALYSVMWLTPAVAQDRSPAPSSDQATSQIEDIVVTARRREEKLQDVPASITAFTAKDLATKGVQQVGDLQFVTPSVRFFAAVARNNEPAYEIRGITTTESLITQDPPVGIYVNEVYRARATGTTQGLFDIESIQTLYGPQGTLFGRNATAGAIVISTRKPTHEFGGEVSAGYGNFNRYELTGALNLPLSPTLALRLAGQRIRSDGFGHDISNNKRLGGTNSWAGRASLLWSPSSSLENVTVFSYFTANEPQTVNGIYGLRACTPAPFPPPNNILGGSPPGSCLYSPVGNAILGRGDLTAQFAAQRGRSPYDVALDPGGDFYERPRTVGVSNTTIVNISDTLKIKNIFGYNHVNYAARTDYDGTSIKIIDNQLNERVQQFSNELQILGENGRLNWVFGGVYFHERGRDVQITTQLQGIAPTNPNYLNTLGTNQSYAVYASGTFKLTDTLSLTAGGRYSWDKRAVTFDHPSFLFGLPTQVCQLDTAVYPTCVASFSKSFSKPTYNVSLDYKIAPEVLLYATTRQGYRSGGFNPRAVRAAQFTPFLPEVVRDVEVGVKSSFSLGGGRRLTANLAVYQSWYDDIQRLVAFDPDGAGPQALTNSIFNAAKATVTGFELNADLTLVRGFNISGFWGYVDGNYKEFTVSGVTLTDIPFPGSKNSFGGTISLTPVDTPKAGKVTFSVTYSRRDSYFGELSSPILEPESRAPVQQLVNLSIDWQDILGKQGLWAQGWVRNATDEASITGIASLATTLGISSASYGPPRTYGLTVGYRF